MVVRRKERAAADVLVQEFHHAPGQRNAVVGARAAADLVQDHQAPRRGRVQDPRRLGHLDHERALPPGQLVAGAHAGENAVGHADPRLAGRHETADLGQQRDQRHLANVRALARHVRTGDQEDRAVGLSGRDVVGHEGPFRLDHVQDRVPPVDDLQLRLLDDLRPAVVPLPGQLGQRDQHVELGQHVGRGLHPPPGRGHGVAEFQEQLVLQLLRLLVGREDLLLILLQLGRDVTLGVLHRLLADVLRGDLLAMRVGDLDVVAENLVEADLERGNAGPLALFGLVAGDPLLAAVGQFAQGVQRLVVSRRE